MSKNILKYHASFVTGFYDGEKLQVGIESNGTDKELTITRGPGFRQWLAEDGLNRADIHHLLDAWLDEENFVGYGIDRIPAS
jgi:hypothetical protein